MGNECGAAIGWRRGANRCLIERMRNSIFVFAFVPLLAACPTSPPPIVSGGDLAAARDLATPPDLAVAPDLATPPDLATAPDLAKGAAFCAGTTVAGTCLQSFFAQVSDCWPATGSCTKNTPSQGASNTCWQGGAQFFSTSDMTMAHGVWKAGNGAITCMTGDAVIVGMGLPIFTFKSLTGDKLGMDFQQSTYTCPDGSTHALPNNFVMDFGGCMALKTLISVPMSGCTNGACP